MIIEKDQHREAGLHLAYQRIGGRAPTPEELASTRATVYSYSDDLGLAAVAVATPGRHPDQVELAIAMEDRMAGKGGFFYRAVLQYLGQTSLYNFALSFAETTSPVSDYLRRLKPLLETPQGTTARCFMFRIPRPPQGG